MVTVLDDVIWTLRTMLPLVVSESPIECCTHNKCVHTKMCCTHNVVHSVHCLKLLLKHLCLFFCSNWNKDVLLTQKVLIFI